MRASVVEHLAHDQLTDDEPMDEVLQNGRRKHRPWTAQEQTTLEVAAACGVSLLDIGKALDRNSGVLSRKIGPSLSPEHKKTRAEKDKDWRDANRQRLNDGSKAWYQANRERKHAVARLWHQANRERHCAMNKTWYKENCQRKNAAAKIWHKLNRDQANAAARSWYRANREDCAASAKAWRAANRKRYNDISRRRKARLRAGRALCEITFADIQMRFLLWNNSCAYCGTTGKMTVDHVLAVKYGGLDEPLNIAPACLTCNSSKNAAPVESWYRRQPFFTEARWRKIQRHCPAAVVGQLPLGFAA